MCKGGCQPQRVPNATQQSGCVWERRSDEANEKYRLRYLKRYAVRDDEGDCNLHGLFFLRNRRRTADYNPSVTSLRTGRHLPLHRGGFSPRRDGSPSQSPPATAPPKGSLGTRLRADEGRELAAEHFLFPISPRKKAGSTHWVLPAFNIYGLNCGKLSPSETQPRRRTWPPSRRRCPWSRRWPGYRP